MSIVVLSDRSRNTFIDAGTFGIAYTAGSATTVTGRGILHGFSAFQPVLSSGSASYTNTVTIDGTSYTMGNQEYIDRVFESSFVIPATTTAWYTLSPTGIINAAGNKTLAGTRLVNSTSHKDGTFTRVAWSVSPTAAGWSTSTTPLNVTGRGILNSISWSAGSAGPDTHQYVAQITIDGLTNTIQISGPQASNYSGPTTFSLLGMQYKTSAKVQVWAYRNNTPGYSLSASGQLFYTPGAI